MNTKQKNDSRASSAGVQNVECALCFINAQAEASLYETTEGKHSETALK